MLWLNRPMYGRVMARLPSGVIVVRGEPNPEDIVNELFVEDDGMLKGVAAFVLMGAKSMVAQDGEGWAPLAAPSSRCQVVLSKVKLLLRITIERASKRALWGAPGSYYLHDLGCIEI
jgi:hypothetical protein